MSLDLTAVFGLFLLLSRAVFLALVPILVPYVLKRLHVANQSDLAERVEAAANAAAGLAYHYALQHEGGLANVPVRDAALGKAISHVLDSVPDAMKALGITPEHVAAMITARLGALLATDPTVSAGRPSAAPPCAPLPEPPGPVAPHLPPIPTPP